MCANQEEAVEGLVQEEDVEGLIKELCRYIDVALAGKNHEWELDPIHIANRFERLIEQTGEIGAIAERRRTNKRRCNALRLISLTIKNAKTLTSIDRNSLQKFRKFESYRLNKSVFFYGA